MNSARSRYGAKRKGLVNVRLGILNRGSQPL